MRFLYVALVCVPRLPPVSLNRYKSWLGFVMACVRMDHTTTVWVAGSLERACMCMVTVYRVRPVQFCAVCVGSVLAYFVVRIYAEYTLYCCSMSMDRCCVFRLL